MPSDAGQHQLHGKPWHSKLQKGCRPGLHGRHAQQTQCTALRQYGGSGESQESAGAVQEKLAAMAAPLRSFYKFSRPHTMIGTFCSVCSISLLALVRPCIDWSISIHSLRCMQYALPAEVDTLQRDGTKASSNQVLCSFCQGPMRL